MNRPAHMARINARQRTIDACNKSVAGELEVKSFSDLMHGLGSGVADATGRVSSHKDAKPHDPEARPFDGLHIDCLIARTDRLEEMAAEHLASLSPERREQLEREWGE